MLVEINNPCTLYIKFTDVMPRTFLFDSMSANEGYYFRFLDGKTPRIKFNIPDPGLYRPNVPIEIVKRCEIEIPDKYPKLPEPDRDRYKPVTYLYNAELDKETISPIRIYTQPGIIEYGNRYLSFIKPIQKFLDFHEKGHMFYSGEENCDFYALVNFIRSGYNQSTALYSLQEILKRTPDNMKRVRELLTNIQKLRK